MGRARRAGRVPVVLQNTASDCGPACLAMVLGALGRPVPLAVLRRDLDAGRDGVTALDLRDGGSPYGVTGRAVRISAEGIASLVLPASVHWENNHFVVVERVGRRGIDIVDPAIGRRRLDDSAFRHGFTGVAVTYAVTGAARMPPPGAASPPWRRLLLPALRSHRHKLAVVVLASALLTGLGFVLPVVTTRVVGNLTGGRRDGALVTVAVPVLAGTVALLALLRGLAVVGLQNGLGRRLSDDVVTTLLRAPFGFFERRGAGDLVARVNSTDVVRDLLATQLVTALLDGLLASSYLAMVSASDLVLGAVGAAVAIGQLGPLSWLSRPAQRLRREELLMQAQCQSRLVEAIAGIATIKAAGAEDIVRGRWQSLNRRQLVAAARRGQLAAVATMMSTVIRVSAPVLFIVVAATRVTDGALGIGQALGLAALMTAALGPLGALATHVQTFHELAPLLDHLADVADTAPEQPVARPPAPRLTGAVRLREVGFRYDPRGPWAVHGVDVCVEPGQKVAIVGRSGSGKSTLAKLLVALYPPTSGALYFDGHDVDEMELRSLRRQLGVVLQDPFLLAGTVQENIALCRPDAPLDDVVAAARLAAVHDDIAALPLDYQTVLADGGAGLSGGQRQRLALARALLPEPAVLLLDEATSHLDVETEATIEQHLRLQSMTRIVVAHRLSTIRDADLILVMDAGAVVERGTHEGLIAAGGRYAAMVGADQVRYDGLASVVG